MYGAAEGKKMCDSTSGWELIFEIYLSGNGLEPSEASQMALSELKQMWSSLELQPLSGCASKCGTCMCTAFIFGIFTVTVNVKEQLKVFSLTKPICLSVSA